MTELVHRFNRGEEVRVTGGAERGQQQQQQQQQIRGAEAEEVGEEDNLSLLRGATAKATGVMRENIQKVMRNGEQLEVIVDKSDSIAEASSRFMGNGTRLRRKVEWDAVKQRIALVVFALAVLGIVVWIANSSSTAGKPS